MLCSFIYFVLGVLFGAFFSWFFSKRYYKKGKRDGDESTKKIINNNIESTTELKIHIDKSTENTVKDGDTMDGGSF